MVRRTLGAGVKAPAGAAREGTGERRAGKEPFCPPPPLRSLGAGEEAWWLLLPALGFPLMPCSQFSREYTVVAAAAVVVVVTMGVGGTTGAEAECTPRGAGLRAAWGRGGRALKGFGACVLPSSALLAVGAQGGVKS